MAMNGKKIPQMTSKEAPKSQRYHVIRKNSELLKLAKQKAHGIVLTLLDAKIDKEYFARSIVYLTRDNFEDVAIERSLNGICGYALCDQSLTDQTFKNQTYIIRNNKVYDVTHRKVRASFDLNVDLEDVEESTKTVTIDRMSPDLSEEDYQIYDTNQSTLTSKEGFETSTVNHSKPNLSGDKILHAEERKEEKNIKNIVNQISNNSTEENGSSSNVSLIPVEIENKLLKEVQNISLDPVKKNLTSENVKPPIVERKEQPNALHTNDVLEIEHVLREWMNFESLRIILGDVYVKGMLEHFGEIWEHYDRSSDIQFPRLDMKAKYIALCKKLNKQEMKEKLEEAQEIAECEEVPDRESLKPVPDYERLQRDVQQSSLKVKAFFEGTEEFMSNKKVLEVIDEEPEGADTEVSTSTRRAKKAVKPRTYEEDKVITLPLIDQYSQKSWRKQIVFEKLGKRLVEFSVDFGLNEREVRKLAIPLIETFDLTAHNINFKMSQWKFIALVIIKMLSVRYPIIAKVFLPTEEKTFPLIAGYLRTMGLDENYLDRLLSYVTDISYILSKTEKIVNLENDYEEESSKLINRKELSQNVKYKYLNSSLHCTDYEQLD
ncbi:putative RNA polymerase II subunit B1 CTD phosphatase RPAP2 [Armadillidium nasatum]|uniref:RNA polymerase II subunit B1 CTD phosphatase RPAP2 homolog n=1 Tax=Armadillidium nasatum TaxID=96803 RepID=A0A5N5TCQ7_9CRUS|nr:putative RNA polymerase II subunit B1 CTD phosphatase RPAP2 [Armadillidium nasatum]